jgi:hypothetical protein
MVKQLKTILRKLTLFDKLIILIAIFAVVFLGYTLFRKQSVINVTVKLYQDTIQSSVWMNDYGARQWSSNYFYPGMSERDSVNRMMAEVKSVYSYDVDANNKAIFLNLALKTTYTKATNQHTYRGSPVLIGSPIKLQLDTILVEGVVTDIEGLPNPREKVTLSATAKLGLSDNPIYFNTHAVNIHIADAVNEGAVYSDNQGNSMVRITGKRVVPATRLIANNLGSVSEVADKEKAVVYLDLEIQAYKTQGKYFLFDDLPIQIGEGLPIILEKISIYPEITDFDEISN